jgi:tRNA pseudouridine38-40 synthase
MSRFKLTLEFEGTRYNGWQVQKNQSTIQGKLLEISKEIFQTDRFEVYGSGRTDRGVHGLGQVAHLDVKTNLDPNKIRISFNDLLPHDINILKVEPVHDRFHARHDAIARSYVYQISRRRTAFGKTFVWWIKDHLDVEKMRDIATLYTGFKDYRSFGDDDPEEKSTLVEVNFVNVHEEGDSIFIHIVGSHFLWKMVRRMVGIMAEVGRGKMQKVEVESFFKRHNSQPARFTAPPSGLYLERVYYPGEKISKEFKKGMNVYFF